MIATATKPSPPVAPSRGRGSKPSATPGRSLVRLSPPHGGVDRNHATGRRSRRRQTSPPHGGVDRNEVVKIIPADPGRRPLTGAWIETGRPWQRPWRRPVAPSRGRGSKPCTEGWHKLLTGVAPSRGRGSKPGLAHPPHPRGSVAPSRGRGSKHHRPMPRRSGTPVAPSRGRGSKRGDPSDRLDRDGRPLTGAWIETLSLSRTPPRRPWSPPHGGVDRNTAADVAFALARGRPLTGAWIETACRRRRSSSRSCRALTGAWIETCRSSRCSGQWIVAPSRGRGSKHPWVNMHRSTPRVAPSRGRGSKPLPDAGCARR